MAHPLQQVLAHIVDLATPASTDADGEWYTIVPNDPVELGQPNCPVGIRVKIQKVVDDSPHSPLPDRYEVVGVTTYNR